jgi:signal transduction histidine kinase
MFTTTFIAGLVLIAAAILVFVLWTIRERRSLQMKMSATEEQNFALGERIEKTKARLLASENARRNLEVSNAVTLERERIMREIHDGIGSGLVAALASAERQGKEGSTAVFALKGALADLKIAVDSLDPVDGNVATLLASLRYRLEPDLRKSGIAFDWNVDDVPSLPWMDAPNALHVLRIFQESIVNIVTHAQATLIRVECRLELSQSRLGVIVAVSDNGKGYDVTSTSGGHGTKNIKARAEALGAQVKLESEPNKGSRTTLWLPLIRGRGNE